MRGPAGTHRSGPSGAALLPSRRLGALPVSAIGFGAMGLTGSYGHADPDDAVATLRLALDRGITLIDTADVYGPRTNEVLVGKALRGRRTEAVVATKFGLLCSDRGEWQGMDGRPEYVRAACEASLRRLGVDHIDLYYQHRLDRTVPIEETVGAMAELVDQGKVRHLGLSEVSPTTVRRACAVHPITAVQSEYSLWSREVEHGLLATLRELGVGFVAYSPLGRGFLTGTLSSFDQLGAADYRRGTPRFQGANFAHNHRLAARLRGLADELGVTPAQLALAWVLRLGPDVVPIPGTRRPDRIEENVGALQVRLTEGQARALDAMFPAGAARGDRYPAARLSELDT